VKASGYDYFKVVYTLCSFLDWLRKYTGNLRIACLQWGYLNFGQPQYEAEIL
jgi:hypothetical protein